MEVENENADNPPQESDANDLVVNVTDSDRVNTLSYNPSIEVGGNLNFNNLRPNYTNSKSNHRAGLQNIEEEKREENEDIIIMPQRTETNYSHNNANYFNNNNSNNFVNILNKAGTMNKNSADINHKKSSSISIPKNENELILFFFINPYSGIEEGKHLINMGVKKVEFSDSLKCKAYIFNMKEETNCSNGIDTLRSELSRIALVKVIVGGGDGSIMEMVGKLSEKGIDLNRCIFGVLPLGRNNDLSRALGWGNKMEMTPDMSKFKVIVHELAEATSIFVDVWELKLSCEEEGGAVIQYGNDMTKHYIPGDLNLDNSIKKPKHLTTFKQNFINYFSLGHDARVGFGFKKSKSSCRCSNFCSYFWESMKKHCCRKTMPVTGFIDSFLVVKIDDEDFDSNKEDTALNETIKEDNAPKDLIFQTVNEKGFINGRAGETNTETDSNSIKVGNKTYERLVLKGDPVSLVCQNINYFIGGPADIWKKSKDNYGVETYNPNIDKKDKKAVEVSLQVSNITLKWFIVYS